MKSSPGMRLTQRYPIAVLGIFMLVTVVSACNDTVTAAMDACLTVGLCNAPPPPPEVYEVLCDAGGGSTCTPTTLAETLTVVLRRAAGRPGSMARLWGLGEDADDTRLLATAESVEPPKSGAGAHRVHAARFVTHASTLFLKAAEPLFTKETRRQSPIAAGLSKIAIASRPAAAAHRIIAISDGLEASGVADFECGPVPTPEKFVAQLGKHRLLAPGVLGGTRIVFTHVDVRTPGKSRCASTVKRSLTVRDAWRAALETAGASSVTFETGVVRFTDDAETNH